MQLVIWGIAESAITIIAASIPILRALLRDGGKPSVAEMTTLDEHHARIKDLEVSAYTEK